MLRDEEHDGQLLLANATLPNHDDLTLRHVVVIRDGDMEVSDPRIDAERRLGVSLRRD